MIPFCLVLYCSRVNPFMSWNVLEIVMTHTVVSSIMLFDLLKNSDGYG